MKQTSLRLEPRTWGGRRKGAGRKRGSNPRLRHLSRETFRRGSPCHVTLKVREDVPSLRSRKLVRELERVFAGGCERGSFRLVHYSLQRDHAHLIVEAADRQALGRGMMSLNSRFGLAVNRVFGRRGSVLRDRYHLHVLRSPREVRNALRYVLLNHRKHGGRLATMQEIDPASSARFFDGWRSLEASFPTSDSPVARPRSWLLLSGWRRGGGRFSPDEVPSDTS